LPHRSDVMSKSLWAGVGGRLHPEMFRPEF
jgi:hypothetical protein